MSCDVDKAWMLGNLPLTSCLTLNEVLNSSVFSSPFLLFSQSVLSINSLSLGFKVYFIYYYWFILFYLI